jgi:hypothetical protein
MEQRPEFLSTFGWPDYLFYLQKLPYHGSIYISRKFTSKITMEKFDNQTCTPILEKCNTAKFAELYT